MCFEWDRKKAAANLRKHGVDFVDAAEVLHDDEALTVQDSSPDEERFVTIGADAGGRILVVIHTAREYRTRIVSARRATRMERRQYGRRR